jgi:muramoyltetrapeptide carboxypeptidase
MSEEEIARYWCGRSGIPWLGRADIGHDIDNKIVPFGAGAWR